MVATVSPGATGAGVVDVMVSVNGIKTVEVEQAADALVLTSKYSTMTLRPPKAKVNKKSMQRRS